VSRIKYTNISTLLKKISGHSVNGVLAKVQAALPFSITRSSEANNMSVIEPEKVVGRV
jgi:hypothetical protein